MWLLAMLDIAGHCGNASADAFTAVNIARHCAHGALYVACDIDVTAHGFNTTDISSNGDFLACVCFELVNVSTDCNVDFLGVWSDVLAVDDDTSVANIDASATSDSGTVNDGPVHDSDFRYNELTTGIAVCTKDPTFVKKSKTKNTPIT